MVVGGMGVRPRSPTSAVRSFAGISELVQLIVESRQQVIFVTGAAFASSSGLVPFRDETVSSPELKRLQERYDSREVYDKNPLVWWNEFWLPLYRVKDQDVNRPNVGHFAIAYMAEHFVNVSVVTLCIDSLHKKAGVSEEKMAHAFGRASDYHCLGQCDSVSSERIKLDLKQNGDLERLPHCPDCHCQVVPVPAFKPWGYTIAEGATVVVVGCSSESLSRLSKDVPNRRVYVIADGVDSEEEKASSIRVIKGPPCKLLAVIAATLERLGEVEGIQMKFWSDYCATAGEHVDSKDNPWVAQTEPVDRVVSTADDDKVASKHKKVEKEQETSVLAKRKRKPSSSSSAKEESRRLARNARKRKATRRGQEKKKKKEGAARSTDLNEEAADILASMSAVP